MSSKSGCVRREENVGKRFLCVSGSHKIKLSRFTEWPWRAGVIRCSSHLDSTDKELQFLVEFDDQPWQSREWINVYTDNYHIFLVESYLCLASRPSTSASRGSFHPAITFKPLLDNVGFYKTKHPAPIEFLTDSLIDFQEILKLKTIREWDSSISGLDTSSCNERAVRAWSELQDGQHILINTPSVLIGFRIKVYRAEGTTQWYTAVTTGYNDDSGEFTLIDDTVLEEHYEDPRLTQMKLLGEGVVESILKGDNIGITPRRSRSSVGSLRVSHQYCGDVRRRVSKKREREPPKKSSPRKRKWSNSSITPRSGTPSHGEEEVKNSEKTSQELPSSKKPKNKILQRDKDEKLPKIKCSDDSISSSIVKTRGNGGSKLSDEHKSPKRKAVAIVRPQPQQLRSLESNKPSEKKSNANSNEGGGNSGSTNANNVSKKEDLKARFSLYDFHSDESETEENRSTGNKVPSLKFSKGKQSRRHKNTSISNEDTDRKESKVDTVTLSREETVISVSKSAETSLTIDSGHNKDKLKNEVKEEDRLESEATTVTPPPVAKNDHGTAKNPSPSHESVVVKMDDDRSDSGISTTIRSSSGDERSGSRSSALSGDEQTRSRRPSSPPNTSSTIIINDKETTSINSQTVNTVIMADHNSDGNPSNGGDRRLLPPNNPLSAAAAANLTALTAHYQAAALQQAGLSPHGGLSPHLLAQYHQSFAAAGLQPDILLKQPYPQFNAAAAAAAAAAASGGGVPPHLIGRNDYALLTRERELAVDRERLFRERAEAEQRERERIEKERKEKERREREELERRSVEQQREILKKQQAVEAVDQHFQLSMELAKKLPAYASRYMLATQKMADAGQHWSQLPGISKEERRKYDESAAYRQQQQYISAMAANIGGSRDPKPFPPYNSKDLAQKEPSVVFKPYETTTRFHPSNSVSPVGGHSTPSPLMSAVSPPTTPFFPTSNNNNGSSQASYPPRTASSSSTSVPRVSPPPAHGLQQPRPSSGHFDELPLDLGSGTKRQSDINDMPPKKAGRFEPTGTLYKVSEPSVLPPEPPPSVINTVVNKAVVNMSASEPATPVMALSNNPSTSSTQDNNSDEDFGYVHKLKKAWIKAYSEPNTAPQTPNHPPIKSSFSNPPTPNPRATPSPALSTNSSKGGGGSCSNKTLNGHSSPKKKAESSSSSDSESSQGPPKKRITIKKGGGSSKGRSKSSSSSSSSSIKTNGNKKSKRPDSDSNSDSDKESIDEKPKKRGRKPGTKKSSNESYESGKKGELPPSTSSTLSPDKKNPFSKPSIAQLKKTGESFLQDASCFEVAPKLAKCRECRWTQSQRNKKMPNIFCRFYAFRRLKFTKNGQLAVSGFCNPIRDASESDIAVWSVQGSKSRLNKEEALGVLKLLKKDFINIMDQERKAQKAHIADDDTVAWKRVVQGVREMCDVCDATLFNFHWACSKCGFVVCVDCYLNRKEEVLRSWGENDKERDRYSWLLCTNRQGHELDKLVLTQIVAGDALEKLENLLNNSSLTLKNGISNGKDDDLKDEEDEAELLEEASVKLEYFKRRGGPLSNRGTIRRWKSVKPYLNDSSSSLSSSISSKNGSFHTWLCDGKVLCLENANEEEDKALEVFKRVWGSGAPVVIKNACKNVSVSSSWSPENLIENFGDIKVDLGEAFSDRSRGTYSLKRFLNGFLDPDKRIKDESGNVLFLKARDWPPQGEEFSEAFPTRSAEFLESLPLPAITDRSSSMNLASSLPDVFVRPDLGPRAWLIHGTSSSPYLGTVNLHLDIADSLNVIVYGSSSKHDVEDMAAISSELEFSPEPDVVAVWHVFHPEDADKIRDLLNKESNEKESDYDHLHDETKYLDKKLREKLVNEYGVSPFTILQRAGDAVLVPAGAPKQVKHLKCCVSLCSDFVSAESLPHSFHLVQSMRYLSESQTMGEDKLQVKNLIFHSVKDAIKALYEEKS